jgi:hypothetical protein
LNEDPINSDSLVLPEGIDHKELVEAVRASGYPLQTVVARELNENFTVVEEWGYVDRTLREHRSLDVFAHRRCVATSPRLQPSLALLVECKRSDLPYVFFSTAIPQITSGFPSIVGFPSRRFSLLQEADGSIEIPPPDFLRCSDFPFVRDAANAVTFCRVERKGKDLCLSGTVPYNKVVLPLASALEHYEESRAGAIPTQPRLYPTLTLCVCVIDAPLVVAGGTPESPELSTARWVRLVHEEALREDRWWRRKQYHVDVVRREFLGEFLEQHVLPFAEQVASRMTEREELVVAGKGKVQNRDSWTWNELQPVGP